MTPLTLFAITTAIVIALGSNKMEKSDKVCLLSDDDGKVGKVFVRTDNSEKIIDKEKYFIKIKDNTISDPILIKEEDFQKWYGNLLASEPARPKSFILYFETGSDNLTSESLQTLEQILEEIKKGKYTELEIIGHTDTVGKKEVNYNLGLKRAETTKNILLSKDIGNNLNIEISSLGEDFPLIPTPDETDEPKNRRVEIILK